MKTKSPPHSIEEFKKHISSELTAADARKIFGSPTKDLGSGDLKRLGMALKTYIESLPATEREKIPDEFRNILLTYTEGLENPTKSMVGGWYFDTTSIPYELTRWHVVSDHRRVAAKTSALWIDEKWVFQNLKFVSAKTVPARSK